MNKTANFQLTQWEKTDRIMMEDFNRDNAAIDAALKANADEVAALQTALAGAGNCSIETQSYTGNGKYGQNNPNSITFSKKPKAVLIFGNRFFWLLTDKTVNPAYAMAFYNAGSRTTWQDINFRWRNSTLTFYHVNDATFQGNMSDTTYYVVALYGKE